MVELPTLYKKYCFVNCTLFSCKQSPSENGSILKGSISSQMAVVHFSEGRQKAKITLTAFSSESDSIPISILYKSIAGRYRPVRVADGPITARYRFIRNASGDLPELFK